MFIKLSDDETYVNSDYIVKVYIVSKSYSNEYVVIAYLTNNQTVSLFSSANKEDCNKYIKDTFLCKQYKILNG